MREVGPRPPHRASGVKVAARFRAPSTARSFRPPTTPTSPTCSTASASLPRFGIGHRDAPPVDGSAGRREPVAEDEALVAVVKDLASDPREQSVGLAWRCPDPIVISPPSGPTVGSTPVRRHRTQVNGHAGQRERRDT